MALQPIQFFSVGKYVRQYISPLLRKPKLQAFLLALVAPLQSFRDSRTDTIYPELEARARYNAQVVRFEKALNIIFQVTTTPIFRGIYLDDSYILPRLYTYNEDEQLPLYVANEDENQPVYIANNLEYLPIFDFAVYVPLAIYNAQLTRVDALVRKYKLAGTTYTLVPY